MGELKCYIKPNRKRVRTYTAKDCGRIVCRAIETGADKAEVRREVEKCLGDICEREKVKQLVFSVLESSASILLAISSFIFVLKALRVASLFLRRFPLLNRVLTGLDKRTTLRLEDAFRNAKDITSQAELLKTVLRL